MNAIQYENRSNKSSLQKKGKKKPKLILAQDGKNKKQRKKNWLICFTWHEYHQAIKETQQKPTNHYAIAKHDTKQSNLHEKCMHKKSNIHLKKKKKISDRHKTFVKHLFSHFNLIILFVSSDLVNEKKNKNKKPPTTFALLSK